MSRIDELKEEIKNLVTKYNELTQQAEQIKPEIIMRQGAIKELERPVQG